MLKAEEPTSVVTAELLLFVSREVEQESVVDRILRRLVPDRGCVPSHITLRAIPATVLDKKVAGGVKRLPLTLDSTFDTILLHW